MADQPLVRIYVLDPGNGKEYKEFPTDGRNRILEGSSYQEGILNGGRKKENVFIGLTQVM